MARDRHLVASPYEPETQFQHQPDASATACLPTHVMVEERNVHLRNPDEPILKDFHWSIVDVERLGHPARVRPDKGF
jgi:hypothetical protein